MEKKKRKIAVLATGGTIASRASSSTEMNNYGQMAGLASLGANALLESVPEISSICDLEVEQVINIGSARMSIEDLLKLARRVAEVSKKEDIDGIVITHGTDTMEETAYFLNLVIPSKKPIVVTGAMRPSTGLSADGPMNLFNSVALAASPQANDFGVMVMMNDKIAPAFGVTKTNTVNTATFLSPEVGFLGVMQDTVPHFFSKPLRRHTVHSEFNIADIKTLPRVDINVGFLGSDGVAVDAFIENGTKGIVNAGVGHGSISNELRESLIKAVEKGIPVILSSRVLSGLVTKMEKYSKFGFLAADAHSPQKARVLLSVALTKTKDPRELERIFAEY